MPKIVVRQNARNRKYKYYCVYMAYSKYEVMDNTVEGFDKFPMYPRTCAILRIYDNRTDQLEAYANTMCSASQCFEADSEEEIKQKEKEFNENFENEEWLEKNIYPFV